MTTETIEFITEVAQDAGEVAQRYGEDARTVRKADGSLVSEADRAVEQLIRRRLQARWPHDGLIGEELGIDDLTQARVWCLDPIDGTHNFVAGLPLWVVSIGLCEHGLPTAGVVHAPRLNLTYTGAPDIGAFVNGRPLTVVQDKELRPNDLIGVTSEANQSLHLHIPHKMRNLGSAALHACYVAAGIFKAAVFPDWCVWDLAAALAIIAPLGVEARTLDGKRLDSLADLDPRQRQGPLVLAPVQLCGRLVASIEQVGE